MRGPAYTGAEQANEAEGQLQCGQATLLHASRASVNHGHCGHCRALEAVQVASASSLAVADAARLLMRPVTRNPWSKQKQRTGQNTRSSA